MRTGMGSVPFADGTAFRVWAPNAEAVFVAGDFNDWSDDRDPLTHEGNGYWAGEIGGVGPGAKYEYVIVNGGRRLWRSDPYGRDVDHSNGPTVIVDPAVFGTGASPPFAMPARHELIVYEMHVGTFNDRPGGAPGNLDTAIARLGHVAELGANAVQIMPLAEFPGAHSWGYNPSHIFAVESDYGGPAGLKAFIAAAHALGLAVIVDVVYNHLGPSDLDLWQFDGWHENGKGGIYFYNDWRSSTPWGDTRPDYGRPEVRQFLRDNALFWLDAFGADGLRWDMTLYIRTVHGNQHDAGQSIADGWGFMQSVNREVRARWPEKISIAEDLQDNEWLTRGAPAGGAGFDAQWAANFVHPVRAALVAGRDEDRSMAAVRDAILDRYGGEAFARVVYTESHDEVANGRARLPHDVAPNDPGGWYARKRSTLGAVLVFTAPGIPMLFQGQEFLEDEWFRDTDPLDWGKKERFAGIFRMYRDLARMRRDRVGFAGLQGQHVNVFHVNDRDKVVAFHRWDRGGPGDDVVVVLNMAARSYESYTIGLPHGGAWRVRFNSDWSGYSPDFGNHLGYDTAADGVPRDGLNLSGNIGIGPYSALILTQAG